MSVATASWFHLRVKTMSRSAGRSVVAAAAYRLGERLHDREIDQTHDYRRRHGVEGSIILAPQDAPAWAMEAEPLWNEASAAEKRINSTLAREAELALPASVPAEAREAITRAFAQELVDRYGVAVTAAIHGPGQGGDERNHHAHILFTTRSIGPEGIGAKTRILDSRKTGPQEVAYLRGFACELINAALEDAGSDERVDHRSYRDRGIEQEPTEHLGPQASGIERRGEVSERGDRNREIVEGNRRRSELIDELAAIEAEIIAAEEARLDDIYGPAGEVALPEAWHQVKGELEAFEAVHAEACERAEAEAPPPEETPLPTAEASTFGEAHDQAMQQAQVDAGHDADSEENGGRFRRFHAWWDNMREYVAGLREQVQERMEYMFHSGDEPKLEPSSSQPDIRPDL